MTRVALLGAGFSRTFGFPLAKHMWPELRRFIRERVASKPLPDGPLREDDYRGDVVEAYEDVVNTMTPIFRALGASRLEEVFTLLDMLQSLGLGDSLPLVLGDYIARRRLWKAEDRRSARSEDGRQLDLAPPALKSREEYEQLVQKHYPYEMSSGMVTSWRGLRQVIGIGLSQVILGHHLRLRQRHVLRSARARVVSRLLSRADAIITTNWDCLAEGLLIESHSWTPTDGHGFRASVPEWALRHRRPDGRLNLRLRSRIPVYKLHGSITWTESDHFGSTLRLVNLAALPLGSRDRLDVLHPELRTHLIHFSYVKPIHDSPLLVHQWSRAADALRTASEVLVIGYSLPAGDQGILQLLQSSLRSANLRRVILVDPLADPAGRSGRTEPLAARYAKLLDVDVISVSMTLDDALSSGAISPRWSVSRSMVNRATRVGRDVEPRPEYLAT